MDSTFLELQSVIQQKVEVQRMDSTLHLVIHLRLN